MRLMKHIDLIVLAIFAKREAFENGLEVNERRSAFHVKIYNTYTRLPKLLPAPACQHRTFEVKVFSAGQS
jgi:hypothetical protein